MKHKYKKVYDPTTGKFIKKHIYGEGFTDIFGNIMSKLTGNAAQEIAKKAAAKAAEASAQKLGEKAGTAIGDRLFSKKGSKPKNIISKIPEYNDKEGKEDIKKVPEVSGQQIIDYLRKEVVRKDVVKKDNELSNIPLTRKVINEVSKSNELSNIPSNIPLTREEINMRVNRLLAGSGLKIRRNKVI